MVTQSLEDRRRGWCPGALRPMESGDGYLVRLRIRGGIVPLARARAIAELAARFGNGQIDLSARGNLQLRGVALADIVAIQEALIDLGLLDENPAAEAVRNVLASPLAGLDPTALADIAPVVAALERHLTETTELHALPGKFGFIVDDGGARLPLDGVAVDIRFRAVGPDRYAIGLADGGAVRWVGACAAVGLPDTAETIGHAFIAQREQGGGRPRRMRAADLAGLLAAVPQPLAPLDELPPSRALKAAPVGMDPSGLFFGVGFAFGRVTAGVLDELADAAEAGGVAAFRLTPWRSILLPGLTDGDLVTSIARRHDAIVTPDDPRLSVVACAGKPGCTAGMAPTQEDGRRFAEAARGWLDLGHRLHLSGCPKGCALPAPTDLVLVANGQGYDIVFNGTAADQAALHLDEETLIERLARLGPATPDWRAALADGNLHG